jgi:hypothetical protein
MNEPRKQMADSRPRHEVGILFVHGIGEQKRGQTLVEFGEPVCRWITQWLDLAIAQWAGTDLTEGSLVRWALQQPDEGVPAELLAEEDPELQIIDQLYAQRSPAHRKRLQLLRPLLDILHASKQGRARLDVPDVQALGERYGLPFIGARATTESASLSALGPIPQPPLNATLNMELLKSDGGVVHTSWKLVESHWADCFLAPNFLPMALWVMLIAPWTAGSYFARRILYQYAALTRRKSAAAGRARTILGCLRLCALVLAAPLALPLALMTQISMALLWLAWLPPVPGLRSWSERFQRKLAAVLGDVYAFAASPLREAAIVDQVLRDVRWLEQRCEKLVIIAHSQGAAVTYLCLRRSIPASLRLVVTFGSGLRKLDEFYRLRRPSPGVHMIWSTFVLTLILYYGFGQALTNLAFAGLPKWGWGWWTLWGLSIAFLVVLFVGFSGEEEDTDFWALGTALKEQGARWLDIYATADPVPNGPIFIPSASSVASEVVESVEVHNFGSISVDHTSYMRNRDEFLGTLVSEISRHTDSLIPLHKFTQRDESTLAFSHRRRAWRVRYLAVARAAAAVILTALFAVYRNHLVELGAAANASIEAWTSYPTSLFGNGAGSGLTLPIGDGVLGAAIIILAVLAGWTVLYGVWLLWDRADTWQFFHRSEFARTAESWLDVAALLLINGWQLLFVIAGIRMLCLAVHLCWPAWADLLPIWPIGLLETGLWAVAAGLFYGTAPSRSGARRAAS